MKLQFFNIRFIHFLFKGHYQSAWECLDDLESKKLHNYKTIAVLFRTRGEIMQEKEKFKDAIRYHEKFLAISQENSDNIEIQRAYATLGQDYYLEAEVTF